MKFKLTAFTLLILMISFAGFSHTTTDLCQNSKFEQVTAVDAVPTVQGVVVSNVMEESFILDVLLVNGHQALAADISKEALIQDQGKTESQHYLLNELANKDNAQTRERTKLLKDHSDAHRLARDGINLHFIV
jgi:hypothetical protein